jgi:glucose-6-phosphate 1-dehydrogenase
MSTQTVDLTNASHVPAQRTNHEAEPDPCTIVIFGASGDLARRKLIPALFELCACGSLGRRFAIVGFARSKMTDDAFRDAMTEAVRKYSESPTAIDEGKLRVFAQSFAYVSGEYGSPEAFGRLMQRVDELDSQHQLEGNRIFYLATPPGVYPTVIEQLRDAHLQQNPNGKSWTRLVVEKPFGRDLASARQLNKTVLDVFDESQVYRIDHYLGKDTVQNLLVLRFGNGIFEPLWNRNFVDSVQITAAESIGIENRASFYESAGALRDMIQSHVLQLTSLVAMEPPFAFDATAVRNEKIKVLQAMRPYTPELVERDVVRGQYGPGGVAGVYLPGYREEQGAAKDSATETYAAARVEIDNWRWAGVPFYIRTGKRMTKRITEIAIQFRRAPHMMFSGQEMGANSLVLNIQPNEGISIMFHAKEPGQEMHLARVAMDFNYQAAFGGGVRSAYATLLNDCMRGDATLFDRGDGVEAAWALVDPILRAWQDDKPDFPNYPAGSWGPREADTLLERDGRHWRKP